MDIYVNIQGQRMSVQNDIKLYAPGSSHFVNFIFDLTPDWDNFTLLVAQFRQEDNVYNVILGSDRTAYLPNEIIAGRFTMMLFGGSGAENITGTTNWIVFNMNDNGIVGNAADVTPTLFEQLLAEIHTYTSETKGYRDEAEDFRDETEALKNQALGYKNDTESIKNQAKGYRDEAEGFRDGSQDLYDSMDMTMFWFYETVARIDGYIEQGSGILDTALTSDVAPAQGKAVGDRLTPLEQLGFTVENGQLCVAFNFNQEES